MLMVIALARVTQPQEYGRELVAYAIFVAFLAVSRGAFGTLISVKAGDPVSVERETRFAAAFVSTIGVIGGLIGLTVFHTTSLVSAVLLLSLAVVLPQDVYRYSAHATGRAVTALYSDGLWFLASLLALVVTATKFCPPLLIVCIWVSGAVLALLLLISKQTSELRWPRGISSWLARDAGDRVRYGLDAGTAALAAVLLTYCVASLIGYEETAALRGAAVIIGPLNVLLGTIPIAVVPRLRESMASGSSFDAALALRMVSPVGTGLSLLALAAGAACLLVPNEVGTALLGETWLIAKPIMPYICVEYMAQGWIALAVGILVARNSSMKVLRIRVAQAVLTLIGGISAALLFKTASGVALSSMIAAWAIASFATFAASRRKPERDPN